MKHKLRFKVAYTCLVLVMAHRGMAVEGNEPEPLIREPEFVPTEAKVTTPIDLLSFFEDPFIKYLSGFYEPEYYRNGLYIGPDFKYEINFYHQAPKRAINFQAVKDNDFVTYQKINMDGYYVLNHDSLYSAAFYSEAYYDRAEDDFLNWPTLWDYKLGGKVIIPMDKFAIIAQLEGETGISKTLWKYSFQRGESKTEIFWNFWDNLGGNLNLEVERARNNVDSGDYSNYLNVKVNPYLIYAIPNLKVKAGLNGYLTYNDTLITPYFESHFDSYPLRVFLEYSPDFYSPDYFLIADGENIIYFNNYLRQARDKFRITGGAKFYLNDDNSLWIKANLQKVEDDFVASYDTSNRMLYVDNYNTIRQDVELTLHNGWQQFKNRCSLTMRVDKFRDDFHSAGGRFYFDHSIIEVDQYYLPFTPKVSLIDTFQFQISDQFLLKLNYFWSGNRNIYIPDKIVSAPLYSYTKVGGSISWEQDNLVLTLAVNNIFNREFPYYPDRYSSGFRGYFGVEHRF
ncbi:hypothetical protein JW877_09375 [bacterium]|nr:hypothetical protein [bacterium]